MTHIAHINGTTHILDSKGVVDFQSSVLEAVRIGGAFVSVPHTRGQSTLILITPASAVHIDEAPSAEAATSPDDEAPVDVAFIDLN